MKKAALESAPSPGAAHVLLIGGAVAALSVYANLPRLLPMGSSLAYFPPFRAGWDANLTDHLGGEYFNIARALARGRGFADPFADETGPTAWMPPVYPALLACLIGAFGRVAPVVVAVVLLQNLSLVFAGWVVLRVAGRTARSPRDLALALALYLGGLVYHFHLGFQFTHDCWLHLALFCGLLLLAESPPVGWGPWTWGAYGGLVTLSGPVLGVVWAALTLDRACRSRRARGLAVSAGVAALVVSPWVARNYLVFGRFIPVKSNLYFELYQSNDLETDGLLRRRTTAAHPYSYDNEARARYLALGEIRFLDEYRARFLASLRANPLGYARKTGNRLAAATLLYHPYSPDEASLSFWAGYLAHPLPFYGLVTLVCAGGWLSRPCQRTAVIAYVVYLTPYVLTAYYERYAFPLLPLEVLMCYWGWQAARGAPAGPRGGSRGGPG
jgi:hypothetical protein